MSMSTSAPIDIDQLNPFNLPTSNYQCIDGQWYYRHQFLQGADATSFMPCSEYWAIDRKGVFSGSTRARVKNPLACRPLNLLFAKDDQAIYYMGGTAKKIADAKTFRVLDAGTYRAADGYDVSFGYACDSISVYSYHLSFGAPKMVRGADVASFSRLAYGFAKDRQFVWRDGVKVKRAKPLRFEPIDDLFSRDANRVFYDDTELDHADPGSTRIFNRYYATDERNVYFQCGRLENADPKSFRVFENMILMSRDNLRVYCGERLLQGVDPDKFQQVGSSFYYRDEQSVFFHSQPVVGADPHSFEQVENSWSRARDKYRSYIDGNPQ